VVVHVVVITPSSSRSGPEPLMQGDLYFLASEDFNSFNNIDLNSSEEQMLGSGKASISLSASEWH
jgi:hypothetical protein